MSEFPRLKLLRDVILKARDIAVKECEDFLDEDDILSIFATGDVTPIFLHYILQHQQWADRVKDKMAATHPSIDNKIKSVYSKLEADFAVKSPHEFRARKRINAIASPTEDWRDHKDMPIPLSDFDQLEERLQKAAFFIFRSAWTEEGGFPTLKDIAAVIMEEAWNQCMAPVETQTMKEIRMFAQVWRILSNDKSLCSGPAKTFELIARIYVALKEGKLVLLNRIKVNRKVPGEQADSERVQALTLRKMSDGADHIETCLMMLADAEGSDCDAVLDRVKRRPQNKKQRNQAAALLLREPQDLSSQEARLLDALVTFRYLFFVFVEQQYYDNWEDFEGFIEHAVDKVESGLQGRRVKRGFVSQVETVQDAELKALAEILASSKYQLHVSWRDVADDLSKRKLTKQKRNFRRVYRIHRTYYGTTMKYMPASSGKAAGPATTTASQPVPKVSMTPSTPTSSPAKARKRTPAKSKRSVSTLSTPNKSAEKKRNKDSVHQKKADSPEL